MLGQPPPAVLGLQARYLITLLTARIKTLELRSTGQPGRLSPHPKAHRDSSRHDGSMDDSVEAFPRTVSTWSRGNVCDKMKRGKFASATGQPLGCPMNRSYLNLLMLKSESSQSRWSKPKLRIRSRHAPISLLWATLAFVTLLSAASAQDFHLQADSLSPDAVAPGGTSSSNLTISADVGFTGTVALTCQVTSSQTTTSPPSCAVSPATVTPPSGATATITTTGQTSPVSYTITITGTGPSTTHTTSPQSLAVLAVSPQFTISVQSPIVPGSVPAGSGG